MPVFSFCLHATTYLATLDSVRLPRELPHAHGVLEQATKLISQGLQSPKLKHGMPLVRVMRLTQCAHPGITGMPAQPPVRPGKPWLPILNCKNFLMTEAVKGCCNSLVVMPGNR